ncbi:MULTISPECIES: DUF58 domain-containing protein [unclassified Paenibacillus]|uniref:DUF58 domain-containing protein n=1 Tax=unclassified Paenibacillus TaxID=185978 RepID=UPI001AE87330|nr:MULTISPECIES: DUF58 domain-containing protein [unclassified Paenibacillus]MBP1156392.1 uncharacterized protein (DUF58 family) [Paenibacillus sp. PvP091]MBP1168222.1 uncharacterized protein (DUF58 family) [Paenibacillus sp. PvR098]MBP2439250.1 uncharacterized protein (DUF58 family) [Paenibacillus sp. PvP052]
MLRTSFAYKLAERPRSSRKLWAVLSVFLGSLAFLLFQGGKLALMLFIIMLILSVYLLLGQWSGIKRAQGVRTLKHNEFGSILEAGSTLGVTIQLQIPGFWPMPYLFVKDRLVHKSGRELMFEATVVPDWKRRAEWEYRTPVMRRGHYIFGTTECVTEDVFGLFEHKGELELSQSIAVLPQTVPIREWQQFHHMMKGTNHHSSTTRAARETTQINGVREYIYGDRLSRIHWNATAKTGTWKSKEFERESLPKTYLFLDRGRQSYPDPEPFELAVSAAASLFQYGAHRGLALGLISTGSGDNYFEPKSGQAQYQAMIQHLIDVEPDGAYSVRQVLMEKISRLAPGSFITLISPVSDEMMLHLLLWLKQQQMKPCHLWVCPDAARKEAWVKRLQSRGIVCYAVQHLSELPSLLGGRIT